MSSEIVAPGRPLEEKLQHVACEIFSVLKEKPADQPLVIGLCGGRSVVGLLHALREESKQQPREIFERIHFFMVDERVVPLSDPQSNYGGLRSLLFDELARDGLIREQQLHPYEATVDTAAHACDAYTQELARYGGAFSVVVLGMGEDGHVAGLFPKNPLLARTESAFFSFSGSPKPPSDRMTASVSLITSSTLGVLLALGEAKRQAWTTFNSPSVSVADCPARMVLSMRRSLIVTDLANPLT